jgi:pyruvate kinase
VAAAASTQAYHQESLDNLKAAQAKTRKLCSVALDTAGPEIVVVNRCVRRRPGLELQLQLQQQQPQRSAQRDP